VRDSLSVLDQLIAGSGDDGLTYESAAALLGFTDGELLDAIIDAFAAGDGAGVFTQIDRVIETGLDPRRFVEDLLERLRDLIVVAAVPDGAASVLRGLPEDQIERMRQQAAAFGQGTLSRAADIVNAGLTEMTGATAPRLQLELICARVLLPTASGESGHAARLDRLERRLDVGGVPTAAASSAAGPAPARQPQAPPVGSAPAGSGAAGSAPAAASDRSEAPAAQASRPEPEEPAGAGAPAGATGAAAARAAVAAARSGAHPQEESRSGSAETGGPAASRRPSAAEPESSPPPRPAAAEPRRQAPTAEPRTPAPTAASAAPAPTAAPTPAAGGIDTAAIRRAWPEVLTWLSRNKRVTWTFVSQHARPLEYDGRRLTLGIATTGLCNTFRSGPHGEWVRQALIDVLGVDARVEGVPAPEEHATEHQTAAAPSASTPVPQQAHADPPSGAPRTSGDPGLSAAARHTPESSEGWASAPSAPGSAPSWASEPVTAAPAFSDAEPAQQVSHLKRALAVVEAEGPAATPEARVADDSAASDDDEDIEGLGEVGRPVIERILGGRVIDEG
jgi:DNA polymerase-3 subunit gamma/tau